MKRNPSTRETHGKFNKPRFPFSRNGSRKYLIIQDLSVKSLIVIIALFFSNGLVLQRVICPAHFFFDDDLFFSSTEHQCFDPGVTGIYYVVSI